MAIIRSGYLSSLRGFTVSQKGERIHEVPRSLVSLLELVLSVIHRTSHISKISHHYLASQYVPAKMLVNHAKMLEYRYDSSRWHVWRSIYKLKDDTDCYSESESRL